MQTLERDRGLDSRLLTDALLDVEVALLNGEGHLFRRFHLKCEKEQNGTFKLSLASDEGTASATNAIRPPQARPNPVAYARYDTTGENAVRAEAYVYPSTQHDGWFTFENSFGEREHGTKEDIAQRFSAFDKRVTINGHLEVKADANDPEHAFFCNLPLMQISDEYRKQAIFIARDPARIAIVVTSHVHSQRMFFFPSLATHQ